MRGDRLSPVMGSSARMKFFTPNRLATIAATAAMTAVALLLVTTAEGEHTGGNLYFTGPGSGYVMVANDAELTPTNAITIEAWVYLTSANTLGGGSPTFVGKNLGTSYWFGMFNGKLQFTMEYHVDSFATGSSNVPLNEWAHVAVTYDKSNVRFYINGVFDGSTSLSYPIGGNSGPLYIGADPSCSGTPDGYIDEVNIWSVARSQALVKQDLVCVHPTSGPIAQWTFDGSTTDTAGSRPGTLIGDVEQNTGPQGGPCGTPIPTPSPARGILGDTDCNGSVAAPDLIAALELLANVVTEAGCPDLANVNCDAGLGADDALRIVRFLVSLPMTQSAGCREINT